MRTGLIPRILNILSLLLFIAGIIYLINNLENLNSIAIWELLFLVGIYSNGIVARMIHMSEVKLDSCNENEEYDVSIWNGSDFGWANCLPIIMEIQYQKRSRNFIQSAISEYEVNEIKTPTILKIADIMLGTRLIICWAVMLIFSMVGLPHVMNEYTLYRGLTMEQSQMALMGISIFLELTFITFINCSMFFIVDDSMDGQASFLSTRLKKVFVIFSAVFASYCLIMLMITIIFGILRIDLVIFSTIVNLNMINIFIVFAPAIAVIQAFILKGKLNSYQHFLNEYLN
jgi:hypothetical protein